MLPKNFRQPRKGWEHRQNTAIDFATTLILFYQSLSDDEKQSFSNLLRKVFKKLVWAYTEAWGPPKYNANPFWSPEAVQAYSARLKNSKDRIARKGLIFEHVVPKTELVEELLKHANTPKISETKIRNLFQKRALSAVITKEQHDNLLNHSTPNPWLRYKRNHIRIADHPDIPRPYRNELNKLKLLA